MMDAVKSALRLAKRHVREVKATEGFYADHAAKQTNTDPTEPQKSAGNYRMGHIDVQGLKISIETPAGAVRRKVDEDGKEHWRVTMPAHYGYIKRTQGADDDQVDVFVGPFTFSPYVFVIDQFKPRGVFDEHKCMIGFWHEVDALNVYDASFSDGSGPERRKSITRMLMPDFKAWLSEGKRREPLAKVFDESKHPRDKSGKFTEVQAAKIGIETGLKRADANSLLATGGVDDRPLGMVKTSLGDVLITLGESGSPGKNFKDGYGLLHAYARRKSGGMAEDEIKRLLLEVPKILKYGKVDPNIPGRYSFTQGDQVVIVARKPDSNTWLVVTTFKTSEDDVKKSEEGGGLAKAGIPFPSASRAVSRALRLSRQSTSLAVRDLKKIRR